MKSLGNFSIILVYFVLKIVKGWRMILRVERKLDRIMILRDV